MPWLTSITVFHSIICFVMYTQSYSEPTYLFHVCPNTTTFAPESIFHSNLNDLLSNLSLQASKGEPFNQKTAGDRNTAAYGIYLCRGDLSNTVCNDCVAFATKDITKRCPFQIETVVWYDECMLRYSNTSFVNTLAEHPRVALLNTANVSQPEVFLMKLEELMIESSREAENGAKRFVTKTIEFSGFQTLYSLMQCTPDLSGGDCTACLAHAIGNLSICCKDKLGGRVLFPSCNVRYEFYPFYDATPSQESNRSVVLPPPLPRPPTQESLPPLPSPGKTTNQISKAAIGGIAILVVLVSLAFGTCSYVLYRRKSRVNKYFDIVQQENNTGIEALQFNLVTIQIATQNFSTDNKLGEGGFGEVYKGVLAEGQEIAVKRLSKSSGQGEREFKNEVALVAKLQHRNLVRLLGFCLEAGETLLVYEFVPNKSLNYFLFDLEKQRLLDWQTRCKIITGVARGILYLHEDSRLRVIHRDLKTSNVLLDGDMQPKISDFGMAKMVGLDQTQGNTKRIVGTYGYMAPEYAMEGLYSVKSDVFSFGVLVLEILSGKKNSGFHLTKFAPSLLSYAWQLWNEGKCLELMDQSLKDSFQPNEFIRYVHIGLLCVQEDAYNRPTMSFVVLMLTTETISLPIPERPAFSVGRFANYDNHLQLQHPAGCEASDNALTISTFGPR